MNFRFIPCRLETFQETIKQQLRATAEFSVETTEVGFYNLTSPEWDDETELEKNITFATLEDMIRTKYLSGFLGSGVSTEFILIIVITVCLAAAIIFVCSIYKGWVSVSLRSRPPRDPNSLQMSSQTGVWTDKQTMSQMDIQCESHEKVKSKDNVKDHEKMKTNGNVTGHKKMAM